MTQIEQQSAGGILDEKTEVQNFEEQNLGEQNLGEQNLEKQNFVEQNLVEQNFGEQNLGDQTFGEQPYYQAGVNVQSEDTVMTESVEDLAPAKPDLIHAPPEQRPEQPQPVGQSIDEIMSAVRDAQWKFDTLEQEAQKYRDARQRRQNAESGLEVFTKAISDSEKLHAELNSELEQLRKKTSDLKRDLGEKRSTEEMISIGQRNHRNIEKLKDIVGYQMNQISDSRQRIAKEAANRNNKLYTAQQYKFDRIPTATRDCEAFEDTQILLRRKKDDLTRVYQTLKMETPKSQQKIDKLEKLVALRVLEAQIHQAYRSEMLAKIDKKFIETRDWFDAEVEASFNQAMENKDMFEDIKKKAVEEYEDYKSQLKDLYGLRDWS